MNWKEKEERQNLLQWPNYEGEKYPKWMVAGGLERSKQMRGIFRTDSMALVNKRILNTKETRELSWLQSFESGWLEEEGCF